MKKSIQMIATALVMLFGNSAVSQNDTMYVMKNGVIIIEQSVNPSDVDSIIFYRPNTTLSITDADGNVYTSVTIGTQEWMVENLRTTKYSDGTAIPNITDDTEWSDLETAAWCHYENDSSQYEATYGKLYNWYAVNTSKLCPTGWHVPTDAEWTVLTNYLAVDGHSGTEGTALKATSGWSWDDNYNKSGNGTDDYGWNGLPGGKRRQGSFRGIGEVGDFWSSSMLSSSNDYYLDNYLDYAWARDLDNDYEAVDRDEDPKNRGNSVRCLRD